MSQSETHKRLVLEVAKALESRYPRLSIITDVQKSPGDPIPPLIDGYRPDLYATISVENWTIIAEAKTDNDLEKTHTYDQIETFVSYLERKGIGLFVLSVTGCRADFAKTLMRFTRRRVHANTTNIAIFDGCDFWQLDPIGYTTWRLS